MLFRVVLVMTTFFAVSLVNAKEPGNGSKQAFELKPDSAVLYRPWSGPTAQDRENVPPPPPPPGPYLSSALSGVSSGFSREAAREDTMAQSSPLVRPDTPWPVKQDRPTMWAPESEVTYAPDTVPSLPGMNQPYGMHRMQQPPMMYRLPVNPAYANPQANFARPQFNQQGSNQQQMYQQRVKQMQEKQQQMRQQQEHQQRMNQPRMNQQRPVWNNFSIPMSNYPRPGQGARQPVQR